MTEPMSGKFPEQGTKYWLANRSDPLFPHLVIWTGREIDKIRFNSNRCYDSKAKAISVGRQLRKEYLKETGEWKERN